MTHGRADRLLAIPPKLTSEEDNPWRYFAGVAVEVAANRFSHVAIVGDVVVDEIAVVDQVGPDFEPRHVLLSIHEAGVRVVKAGDPAEVRIGNEPTVVRVGRNVVLMTGKGKHPSVVGEAVLALVRRSRVDRAKPHLLFLQKAVDPQPSRIHW